jgi:hypothetical protein
MLGAYGRALKAIGRQIVPKLDYEQIRQCLDEIEAALFIVADGEECQKFHKDTQLTATVLLLLRMSSLIRPLLVLLQSEDFDGFDAVLRAFEESYYLAHEFRLSARNNRAMAWLADDKNSWSPRIDVVKTFIEGRGHHNSKMGHDYGVLSELAHPTLTAAGNTATLCGVRRGIPGAKVELGHARENNQERIRYALYRLAWLVLDQDAQFIPIPVVPKSIPLSEKFLETYEHIEPGT